MRVWMHESMYVSKHVCVYDYACKEETMHAGHHIQSSSFIWKVALHIKTRAVMGWKKWAKGNSHRTQHLHGRSVSRSMCARHVYLSLLFFVCVCLCVCAHVCCSGVHLCVRVSVKHLKRCKTFLYVGFLVPPGGVAYHQGPRATKLPDCMGYSAWSALRTCTNFQFLWHSDDILLSPEAAHRFSCNHCLTLAPVRFTVG